MNIEFLNWLKTTIRKEPRQKNRGSEPNQALIHIYMEVSQGNSLCSYLKQEKMSFFSCIFYTKLENWRENKSCLGDLITSGRSREDGERV
jgi:hypothetical protein